MQRETLSVVHRRMLVLAGLGAVDYVTLEPLSERRSLRRTALLTNTSARICGAMLKAIQDGAIAREWTAENDEGRPRFIPMRGSAQNAPIEGSGKELRAIMPWMGPEVVAGTS